MFNIYIKTQKLKLTSHMWSAAFELIWHREASWALTDHINQKLRGYQFGVQLEQRAFLFHKQRAFAFVCGRGHPLPRTYISVPSLPKKKNMLRALGKPLAILFLFYQIQYLHFFISLIEDRARSSFCFSLTNLSSGSLFWFLFCKCFKAKVFT